MSQSQQLCVMRVRDRPGRGAANAESQISSRS